MTYAKRDHFKSRTRSLSNIGQLNVYMSNQNFIRTIIEGAIHDQSENLN